MRVRLSLWLFLLAIALVGAVWQTARLLPQSAIAIDSIRSTGAQLELAHTLGRGRIESVEWSPDSSTILVNTVAGAWLYTPQLEDKAHLPDAFLATYSPDGRYLAVINHERHLLLLSPTTYEVLHTVESTWRDITMVEFSPDGRYLAYGGMESQYHGVNLRSLDQLSIEGVSGPLILPRSNVLQLEWSPDGVFLSILMASNHEIKVIEAATGAHMLTSQYYEIPSGFSTLH
jgi:WD40 repeat protein